MQEHEKKLQTLSPPGNLPEFKISLRFKNRKSQPISITDTEQCAKFARSVYDDDNINWIESAFCLFLNQANRVLGYIKISSGGISSTLIDPRVVFQAALLANASAIILTHNHPSGKVLPGTLDLEITYKLQNAAQYLDIKFLDHIIITQKDYFSFADNGLLKKNQIT